MQVAPCVCQLQSTALRLSLCDLPAERVRRHEVRECPLAVDLDDGQQLAVTGLQLRIAVDRNLFELEAELLSKLEESRPRLLAEMAADGAIEAD